MPIPPFQSLMLPLLELLRDGQDHRFADLVPILENQCGLSQNEREEMIPSGRMPTFRSRMHWAATYMAAAGLVSRPRRGWLQITNRGTEALDQQLHGIDIRYLDQYPEFRKFRYGGGNKQPVTPSSESDEPLSIIDTQFTPEESLENNYRALRQQLAEELLEKLKQGSPQFFEQVVVDLLVAMGYGGSRPSVAKAVGKSGDEGIDGVINEDKLGLDVVYIQAKRWNGSVGSPIVQQFAGSLEGKKASKGVLITTSSFTKDARSFIDLINKRIVLIDGEQLADFMIDHDVGVTTTQTYVLKRIDNDYFED